MWFVICITGINQKAVHDNGIVHTSVIKIVSVFPGLITQLEKFMQS